MNLLLVIGYGIGNQLLKTPLIRALHSVGHRLTVVSEYVGIDVLAGHPYINALHRWFPGHQENELAISRELSKHHFDASIACAPVHGNAPDVFTRFADRILNVGKIERWTKHEAEVNLDYARQLGWSGSWERSELFIPDEVDEWASVQAKTVFGDRLVFGMHFGCINHYNWRYKKWPLENYIELADRLHRDFGAYIVLVGGPDERNEADQVVHSLDLDVQKFVLDAVNKTDIKRTGALIKQCDVFISNDSGPMHMAAAVETPIVGIFGMSNLTKNSPWTLPGKSVVIKKDLWCQPCYGTERHGMCRRGDCLTIPTDIVYEAVVKLKEDCETRS